MDIEFTEQEIQALNNLLDVAIKSEGFNVAADAMYFNRKFANAMQKKKAQEEISEEE